MKELLPAGRPIIHTEYGRGYRIEGLMGHSEILSYNDDFRSFIDSSPDFIKLNDGDGRWLAVNNSALNIFGLHNFSWRGCTNAQIAEILPQFRDVFVNCTASDEVAWEVGSTCNSVMTFLIEDVEHTFYVSKSPFFNQDGSRRVLVIFGRDVTDLLSMQQKELGKR